MRTILVGSVLAVVTGCSGGDATTDATDPTAPPTGGFALEGEWVDDFGTEHVITESVWTQTFPGAAPYTFDIDSLGTDSLVAQNGAGNGYFPGLWSRFDWVLVDGDPWYCQSVFDAADAESAADAPDADRGDRDAGCGGFSFTHLAPAP